MNVAPAAKIQVLNPDNYTKFDLKDCHYPVWIEKHLENLFNMTKVDVAGWGSFRRLVLLQDIDEIAEKSIPV